MERKAYVLTDQQLVNLSKFLERTELKGSEVGAYMELIGIFNNPIPMSQPVEAPEVETERAS